jgi:hypothetical protein
MNESNFHNTLQPNTVSAQVVRRVLEKINDQQLRARDGVESEVQLSRDRACARDPVGAGAAMACHFDLSINSLFPSTICLAC